MRVLLVMGRSLLSCPSSSPKVLSWTESTGLPSPAPRLSCLRYIAMPRQLNDIYPRSHLLLDCARDGHHSPKWRIYTGGRSAGRSRCEAFACQVCFLRQCHAQRGDAVYQSKAQGQEHASSLCGGSSCCRLQAVDKTIESAFPIVKQVEDSISQVEEERE